jgi:adenine/guanine/hypoxanthine permease
MRPRLRQYLEQYFEFNRLGANWRTELLAGATTFATMAYIVLVNPSILREAGMPFQAVVAATCFCAAFGSILMGAVARYPVALAPGMGLNAYFTYTVVKGMGLPWQTALGAVFLSGIAFFILTLAGIRQLIIEAIPAELYAAVAAGIGLFIAMIGLRNAGIVVASPSTLVTLGNLRDKNTAVAIFGLALTCALMAWRVRAAMLLGIVGTALASAALGLMKWTPAAYRVSDILATAGKLDVRGALHIGLLEIVFVFLFVDLFDNLGTLVGVGKRAGLFDQARPGQAKRDRAKSDQATRIPRLNRILLCDAAATVAGSFAGTSTVTSYIESAAGVAAGGRTGVTAIVTGLLFVVALFVAPLLGAVPTAATAPALILVGSLMMSHAAEIDWDVPTLAIPAFLTMLTIPLTFSIATGLSFGFTSYALLKLVHGEFRKKDWIVYLLAAIFVARFIYLGSV